MRFSLKIIQTLATKILLVFITFLISYVVIKLVGAAGQGQITTLLTSCLLISSIFFMSIGSGLIYYSNHENDISGYYSVTFFLSIILTLFLLILLFLCKDFFVEKFLKLNNPYFFDVALVLIAALNLGKLSNSISRANHNSMLYNGAIFSEKFLYFIIILIFWLKGINVSVFQIIYFLLLALIISHLIVIIRYINLLSFLKIKFRRIKNIFLFSLKGHIGVIIQKLNLKFDIILLSYLFSSNIVGYYSISVLFSYIVLYIPDSIAVFLYPKLSKIKNFDEKLELTLKINRITFLTVLIISFFIILFGRIILTSFYGKEFEISYIPLTILLIGSILFTLVKIITKLSTADGNPAVGSRISFIGIMVNIPLLIILVPKYQIIGAAIATSVSYFLMSMYALYWLVKRSKKITFEKLFILNSNDINMVKNILKHKK
tara:strand:+ start:13126 stop:14421 length:1296 start_codon:yes stop_codon:yes gene_type:complete